MQIHQRGWVTKANRTKREPIIRRIPYRVCSSCGGLLNNWYTFILTKLKDFLPKDFKFLCCKCAFRKAFDLEECPVCGEETRGGWVDNQPAICCNREYSCWSRVFEIRHVEKTIKDFFKNLW